jgi:HEAT repeat protein
MGYGSNEDFLGGLFPNTDPMLPITLREDSLLLTDVTNLRSVRPSRSSFPPHLGNKMTASEQNHTREDFLRRFSSPFWEERVSALQALQKADRAQRFQALPELRRIIMDEHQYVRLAAIEVLGTLEQDVPLAPLISALMDNFWDIRAAASQILGTLKERTPIQLLIDMLNIEHDENVREALVRALGKQGQRVPLPIFVLVLQHDSNWLVREAAAWALGETKLSEAIPPLVQALKDDSDENVRVMVAQSLGILGKKEAEKPLFEVFCYDTDEDVREAAAQALQQLDEETRGLAIQNYVQQLIQSDDNLLEDFFHLLLNEGNATDLFFSTKRPSGLQTFHRLTEFIKNKKGYVDQSCSSITTQGEALLFHCFYQSTGLSFQEFVLQSLEDVTRIQPLEAALEDPNEVVRAAARAALEVREKRQWHDLLIVSFALLHSSRNEKEQPPLQVVVSGIGCHEVRRDDDSVLKQIMMAWTDMAEEPLACQRPHDVIDLRIWYQTRSQHYAQQAASW